MIRPFNKPQPIIYFDRLLERVRLLADEYPERINETIYWDYLLSQPGCIVGTALYQFGIAVRLEHNSIGIRSLPWGELGFTSPVESQTRWLELVQNAQDAGVTWGESVKRADEKMMASRARLARLAAS